MWSSFSIAVVWFAFARNAEAQQLQQIWPETSKEGRTINGTFLELTHAPLIKGRWNPNTKYFNSYFYEPAVGPGPNPDLTPDWKTEEVPPTPHAQNYYGEFERPYKLHPFTMSAAYWENSSEGGKVDHPQLLGCYCCTVYKRTVPLSTCAVITTRHILTTATATELVLKDHQDAKNLTDILGAYYDYSHFGSNNSDYMTPARIHYHPKYVMPENVNASHPIPAMYDLAIWASTYPFRRNPDRQQETYICNRAGSYWLQHASPTLGAVNQPVAIVVGYQFILWFKRHPLPWYKYAVKTQKYSGKCPKTEWGWFFCIWGRWAMLGLDSGAALHRSTQAQNWLYDGLLGIGAFSMDLRAKELTHYFTPIENHSALTFMYDAYMGRLKYRFLDDRFFDTKWKAPTPKPWHKISWTYPCTEETLSWDKQFNPPNFY